MSIEFEKGDLVAYHSIIGGPITSIGHTVQSIELMPNNYGTNVAWITGKTGCVSIAALSAAEEWSAIDNHPITEVMRMTNMQKLELKLCELKLRGVKSITVTPASDMDGVDPEELAGELLKVFDAMIAGNGRPLKHNDSKKKSGLGLFADKDTLGQTVDKELINTMAEELK